MSALEFACECCGQLAYRPPRDTRKLCPHCRRSCGMAMVGREFVLAHRDWNAAGELVEAPGPSGG